VSSNERIKQDIINQLFWDPTVDASCISVEVLAGHVRLKGTVASYGERRAAYADAVTIPGIVTVENRIEIRKPRVQYASMT
jgi:osmotically-inducible protein OsmY